MPYTSDFVYLRLLGTLGNNGTGVGTWSVGLKIPRPNGSVSTAHMVAFLSAIQAQASAMHGSTGMKASTVCFLKQLSAAFIGQDGKYVGGGGQTTTVYTYPTPVAGSGAVVLPYSTANVISLRTPVTRGTASNGRVYYPALAQAVDGATGGFIPASMVSVATTWKTFHDIVNTQSAVTLPTGSAKVSVMSAVGAGHTEPVTSIRVGVRPDRQERREDGVVENYQTASINFSADELAAIEERRWDRDVHRRP